MNISELKILAVDDNPINLKLLDRTLSNNNFNVVSASSGEDALETANREKPDLILLDVIMPRMDGYQTCKILKENNDTKHIPVIFLSAKNETVDKAKGLALGAVDYLTKPFDPVEIIARIRTHLAIREEVIELRRRYDELKSKQTVEDKGTDDQIPYQEQLKYIDTLKNINYNNSNRSFQVATRVKFSKRPVTTVFIPGYMDNQNFIYLVSGGFVKDYKTSFVQILLEKYINGYLNGLNEKNFNYHALYKIFDMILDNFSPDIYDTAFTLSLGYVNAAKNEITVYAIHQSLPFVLNTDGSEFKAEASPVFYESKYARIINASKIRVPAGGMVFNYLAGKNLTTESDMESINLFSATSRYKDVSKLVNNIFENLPESERDQLIMAIRLL